MVHLCMHSTTRCTHKDNCVVARRLAALDDVAIFRSGSELDSNELKHMILKPCYGRRQNTCADSLTPSNAHMIRGQAALGAKRSAEVGLCSQDSAAMRIDHVMSEFSSHETSYVVHSDYSHKSNLYLITYNLSTVHVWSVLLRCARNLKYMCVAMI